MNSGPTRAEDYTPEQLILVREACLYIATRLGDLRDELVIVGGLVPSLLIPQDTLPPGAEVHVGTMDVDVGMTLGLVDDGRYHALAERLREAGFKPDTNKVGNMVRNRWVITDPRTCAIDFLIEPRDADQVPGKLQNLEHDLAAVVTPGIDLAFRDRKAVTLEGLTIKKERAKRDIWVCGPGAFVVLKALATRRRGKDKDTYDLFYVLRNFGAGVEDVAAHLRPLLDDADTQHALSVLREDFCAMDRTGPMRVAEFMGQRGNDDLLADVVGVVQDLLARAL